MDVFEEEAGGTILPVAAPLPLPIPPLRDDEEDALCARFEAEEALRAEGECAIGVDYPDGPLSPVGLPMVNDEGPGKPRTYLALGAMTADNCATFVCCQYTPFSP